MVCTLSADNIKLHIAAKIYDTKIVDKRCEYSLQFGINQSMDAMGVYQFFIANYYHEALTRLAG